MKKQTLNIFGKGLNTDLNPLITPPDVLSEARNVDYITTDGDQLILQKRMGNDPELWVEAEGEQGTIVTLKPGYKPLAVKELNNIAYIISYKDNGDGTVSGEIGTFPSPRYLDFKYWPSAVIDPTPIIIEFEFDDGLDIDPDFDLDPDLVTTKYCQLTEVVSEPYTITNNANIDDNINIFTDADFLYTSPNTYEVSASGTTGFDIYMNNTVPGFTPSTTITATSLTDPTVQRTSEWKNVTIWAQADTLARGDWYSIAQETGDNILGTDVWMPLDTAPVIEFYVGFPPAYPHKTIQVHWDFVHAGGGISNGVVTNIDVYYDSSGTVTENAGILTFTDSAHVRCALRDLESVLPDAQVLLTERVILWVRTMNDLTEVDELEWVADRDYGSGGVFDKSFGVRKLTSLTKWQWGNPRFRK